MFGILYDVDGSTDIVEVKSFTDIKKHINGYVGVVFLKNGYYVYDDDAIIKDIVENKHAALKDIFSCKMYGPILYLKENWKHLPYESK